MDVVGGTAWVWSRPEFAGRLDVLVVDEAGQFSLANAVASESWPASSTTRTSTASANSGRDQSQAVPPTTFDFARLECLDQRRRTACRTWRRPTCNRPIWSAF